MIFFLGLFILRPDTKSVEDEFVNEILKVYLAENSIRALNEATAEILQRNGISVEEDAQRSVDLTVTRNGSKFRVKMVYHGLRGDLNEEYLYIYSFGYKIELQSFAHYDANFEP